MSDNQSFVGKIMNFTILQLEHKKQIFVKKSQVSLNRIFLTSNRYFFCHKNQKIEKQLVFDQSEYWWYLVNLVWRNLLVSWNWSRMEELLQLWQPQTPGQLDVRSSDAPTILQIFNISKAVLAAFGRERANVWLNLSLIINVPFIP